MKSRVRRLARRFSRYGRFVLPLLAIPHVRRRRGVNVVSAAHYGLSVGRAFDSDESAAQHYFRSGWRLGVVPNTLIDAPDVRFSLLASLRLRNSLARLARTGVLSDSASRPSRLLHRGDFAERHPELLSSPLGWVGAIMGMHSHQRERLFLQARGRKLTWAEYEEDARRLHGAARIVLDRGLIDGAFYSSQVGGARFLSPESALDDYIANGERDGRSPHPFFDAEWYEDHELAQQVLRGQPINQYLDFIARGEVGEAGPHFWGLKYARLLEARGEDAPVSLLAHFTEKASRQQLTPSSSEVTSVPRDLAESTARVRMDQYHRGLTRLAAQGPIQRRHIAVAGSQADPLPIAVFIDGRLIGEEAAADMVALLERQTQRPQLIAVVGGDSIAPAQYIAAQSFDDLGIEIIDRRSGESFGAAVSRLITERDAAAWAVWTPQQEWAPDYLDAMGRALAAHESIHLAAAVTPTTPQPWLRTDDGLWLDDLEAAGVAVRARGKASMMPADVEYGVMEDIALRACEGAACGYIDAALIERRTDRRDLSAARAAVNTARSSRLLASVDGSERSTDIGVAIPTYEDWRLTVSAVKAVLAHSPSNVRVVVVDNGSRRPVASALALAFLADSRVTIRRLLRNTDFALGCNIGAGLLSARTLVLLNNDTLVQPGWLSPLLGRLDDPGVVAVQPLLLYGDRTVQTAGTVFSGGVSMPRHLLAGYHVLDVSPRIDEYRFSAITAACMIVRGEDFASVGGFDTRYINGMEDVDLCLTLSERTGKTLRVCTASHVVHLESKTAGRSDHLLANRLRFVAKWNSKLVDELDDRTVLDHTTLVISDIRWLPQGASPLREPEIIVSRREQPLTVSEKTPRLRWAIKISSTGDTRGDTWGDEYFARDLAAALGRLGQETVIDRSTSHTRPGSDAWDDVTLTLRGLVPFIPQPGAVNLLWVISHPDMVTADELRSGYSRVYAAGAGWARAATQRWGVPVHTLLQATDGTRFTPEARRDSHQHDVLFVGRTRAVERPIVRDSIAAGMDVEVYGDDGWEEFIAPRFIRGTGISNADLPRAYAGARLVLNDHWPDMARQGFFSNRLFDAAAAGARVISDHVPGMEDVFGRQVRVYDSVSSLASIAADDEWPDDDEILALSEAVRARHSFDARARELMDAALELRPER